MKRFVVFTLLVVVSAIALTFSQWFITTDKSSYGADEVVQITYTNFSSDAVTFPNTAPWQVVNRQGKVIYRPTAGQLLWELPSGEQYQWNWDRRIGDGTSYCPPGWYRIHFYTTGQRSQPFRLRNN
ncbi:hypothetical protein HY844_01330 [Candidatus Berkelbacteria bacterium]|nr:hypothetical protein [Candidatus Berkelbacteria bacterium]